MNFVGLTPGQLLATAAGAATITVVLYLLRLRRRPIEVPFSPLWQAVLAESQSTRMMSRLQHLWSLLLSLLLSAALVFAIADPRLDDSDELTHTVILIDCSPSMAATDVAPNRLSAGVDRVRELIERKRPGEYFVIARMADVTTPLTSMTDAATELAQGLDRIGPGYREADLPRALAFAADMLAQRSRGRIIVVSDGSLTRHPEAERSALPDGVKLRFIAVGESGGNVAIESFSVRRYPLDRSRSELLIEIHNTGDVPAQAELTLLADGRAIAVEPLTLAPAQRLRRIYDNISAANQQLEARIRVLSGPTDYLAIDDHAYATVPPRRRARVLAVTDGNLYLQAALLLDEYLNVDIVAPADFHDGAGYDAVIFDGVLPRTAPAVPALYLHPDPATGGEAPLLVDGRIEQPYFDRLRRDDPLLRWTALRDVNVASALRLRPRAQDTVVAAAKQGPLIVRGERGGQPFVAIAFDIRESDLPLRAAWPLLLLNILDGFWPDGTSAQPAGRVGERLTVHLTPDADARIEDPGGHPVATTAGEHGLSFIPTRPGFYILHSGAQRLTLAVNLPADLIADIAPERRLEVRAAGPAPSPTHISRRTPLPLWTLLVLAAGMLLAVEWWTYHRRWTV